MALCKSGIGWNYVSIRCFLMYYVLNKQTQLYVFSDSELCVARKYLERNTSARDLEDDLEHSASIAKIDADEATIVQDRSIIFTKHERPLTTTEATQIVAKELTSTIQDTGQYIQNVRTHIDRQMSTINRIKAQKEEFDRELEMLQFGSQRPKKDSPVDEMKKDS